MLRNLLVGNPSLVIECKAGEDLLKGDIVWWRNKEKMIVKKYFTSRFRFMQMFLNSRVAGIVLTNSKKGEICKLFIEGIIELPYKKQGGIR